MWYIINSMYPDLDIYALSCFYYENLDLLSIRKMVIISYEFVVAETLGKEL